MRPKALSLNFQSKHLARQQTVQFYHRFFGFNFGSLFGNDSGESRHDFVRHNQIKPGDKSFTHLAYFIRDRSVTGGSAFQFIKEISHQFTKRHFDRDGGTIVSEIFRITDFPFVIKQHLHNITDIFDGSNNFKFTQGSKTFSINPSSGKK